jgi:Glycosyltransferase family 92
VATEKRLRRPGAFAMSAYLAIGTVYQDEAPYLEEWIEFHRLVGIERFFLYDNRSEDEHREVLAPYVEEGIAVIHDWQEPYLPTGQVNAFAHCIQHHRQDARWIAIMDVDTFLFSPTRRRVSDVLRDYESFPGVGVHWLSFGNSGHETKPPGLVIESYLHRAEDAHNRLIKSIVDPTRVNEVLSPHHCSYTQGDGVDENKDPLDGAWARSRSCSILRLNHYTWKSEEEHQKWIARWASLQRHGPGKRRANSPERRQRRKQELNEVRDETILTYVDPLRQAIARRARRYAAR